MVCLFQGHGVRKIRTTIHEGTQVAENSLRERFCEMCMPYFDKGQYKLFGLFSINMRSCSDFNWWQLCSAYKGAYCVFKELYDKDVFLVCVRAVSHWKPIINWNFQLFIQWPSIVRHSAAGLLEDGVLCSDKMFIERFINKCKQTKFSSSLLMN